MKRYAVILVLSLFCIITAAGCTKKGQDKTDPTGSDATGAAKIIVPATEVPDSEEVTTAPADISEGGEAKAGSASVSASVQTYANGKISVEYPVVSNLSPSPIQDKVNKLLNENALEFIKEYNVDESSDTLSVKCKVVSVDRKRLTAVYTGSYMPKGGAHPVNLFYTNTVDMTLGENMGLTDYADPYTLAGYVLSDDCRFAGADPDSREELMKEKNATDIKAYTDMFNRADFPYKAPKDASSKTIKFPEVFSYEDQGTIYVSIPVIHALGDYALIKYTPETK